MNRKLSRLASICLYVSATAWVTPCSGAVPAAPATLWAQRYNGPASREDYPKGIVIDAAGNVVVTGHSFNSNFDVDYGTAKYAAADGALLWQRRFDGLTHLEDYAEAITTDSAGNVIVTGYTLNKVGSYDIHTVKYSWEGSEVLWERRYLHPSGGGGGGRAVLVTPSGEIVVTGNFHGGTNEDVYTAKYAAANGAPLWEHIFNGPKNGNDIPIAMAVDEAGDIAVLAQSDGGETSIDFCTIKYSGTNGALLWSKQYAGTGTTDQPSDVAMDATGNVVVTGTTYPLGSLGDYYTAKYAAADGTLLWEKHYNGPQGYSDQASAVAIDTDGNVVVTGSSASFPGGRDIYTVKYAANDGAVLWERRYDSPHHGADAATAVAIDPDNHVVVAGTAYNGSSDDFCILKYSGTDGLLIWQGSYDGPEQGDDTLGPKCLAVDSNGKVAIAGTSRGSNRADYAIVVYRDPSPTITSLNCSNGVCVLDAVGLPTFEYRIEASTNLTQWLPIGIQTSGSNGFLQFIVPSAAEYSRKFFRIRGH